MDIKIDIENMVTDAIRAKLSPEYLQPIIEKNVGDALKEAIESQFRWSSPFKKLLEESLKEKMPLAVADMGLYSDHVCKAVVTQLNALQMEHAVASVKPMLEQITKPLPATMKVSEVLDLVFKDFNGEHEDHRERNESPTFIVKRTYPNSTSLHDHMSLYIDPKVDQAPSACQYCLSFDGKGKCTGISIDKESYKEKVFLGCRHDVTRVLIQLYTQQVNVVFDQTDIDMDDYRYSQPDDDI